MSIRKEVFQAKVLQKLYPAPAELKLEKVIDPPSTTEVESIGNKDGVIATNNKPVKGNGDGGITFAGRRLYTVLPPPEGYRGGAELPVVGPALESTSKGSDQSEEADDIQEEQPRRKRRRRKKKVSEVPADRSEVKESVTGSEVDAAQTTSAAERLSRNKKRKLKKKRHKEKQRSLGLAPPASAVEFTYQHTEDAEEEEDKTEDEEEEEEEFNDEHANEVLEFLETTLQTYISDRSSPERTPPSGAVALLGSLSDRTAPPGELARLRGLKDLVLRRSVEELSRALEEFRSSTAISLEEASAVYTLFHYWITDIFPLGAEVLKT
ncbi:uncharacterized protein erich1 [Alosa pseudoharengus]|uniref:uncharacterized protein erich1 n=1 Tax=Alosa pseudoharengus TaxID=34774 RepID=UPI003F8B505A